MEYLAGETQVAVIGAGHAGIEAAVACARLGVQTTLFSLCLDAVGNLPCNPSIGGTAKGHLVREIDALGGVMGKIADAVTIQGRMLNRGKGPAVHSPRAQVDRSAYQREVKKLVERTPNLKLRQAEIVDIRLDENGRVNAVVTDLGGICHCRAAILCTGTYLNAKTFVGSFSRASGPDGLHPANRLTDCLRRLGLPIRRFKTGTPARVHRASIDFTQLEEQPGDSPIIPFSFETLVPPVNRIHCHIAYTNADTHRIIRENIGRSAIFGGEIVGAGARYCPSIEDKITRFADKSRHQIFVEPVGLDTEEIYLQGASSSLPEDVQIAFYRSIAGFSRLEIMRCAYAIEYDCIDPLTLRPTLEFQDISGLFGAGQVNGTSGYEEAAAQGMVAGINAAYNILKESPFVLDRSSSYIGTLIDDLTTKGCSDPYRMMTSRSEYRLLLRHDNADARLTPLGREIGLIADDRWADFQKKMESIEQEIKRLRGTHIPPSETLREILVSCGTPNVSDGANLADLIRRPQIGYRDLTQVDLSRPALPPEVAEQAELEIKYEGYIRKQLVQVEQMKRLEDVLLPEDLDYSQLRGIRLEAREKLGQIRPRSLGQASRISGVNPADISVLAIHLGRR
ncbi:MAG: tRNA uridine-5-carboxymethylaminomethyl(34) synthesis enzyme MnmG [Oscillospiraceae bacterium]|nr:tRNA uridine-5-carboxymethylaminomethyl(34) synthesis enzyme MnmG [Oscillospiraceae bacterium]